MNIQEYISSGIVESYVLGLADNAERAEFERKCAAHPELLSARTAFEIALETQALTNALNPPAKLRSRIFEGIQIDQRDSNPFTKDAPTSDSASRQLTPVATMSWMRYLAAASVILLIGSTVLNLYFFNQYKSYSQRYDELLASQTELANTNKVLQTKLDGYQENLALITQPDVQVVNLSGAAVPGTTDSSRSVTVFWNQASKNVFLLVNNLPQPAANQQYQLWALVDGVPVDAGVFTMDRDQAILPMKNVLRAQAFAITLEPKGGSKSPTMQTMQVLGKV